MYKPPTNIASYWQIVDANWDDLFHIINLYLPTFQKMWIDKTPLDKTLGEYIVELKEARSNRLVRAIHAVMWALPEDIGVWDLPVLPKLYDLCINECFLYEEKELDD